MTAWVVFLAIYCILSALILMLFARRIGRRPEIILLHVLPLLIGGIVGVFSNPTGDPISYLAEAGKAALAFLLLSLVSSFLGSYMTTGRRSFPELFALLWTASSMFVVFLALARLGVP
jgi:hypothetical protein